MQAVMIRDVQQDQRTLAVDLRGVLDALGARAAASVWRVRDVWALGDAAPELEALDERQAVSGARLQGLARGVYQVIDGVFSGFDPGASARWVVVQALDSSYYIVHSAKVRRPRNHPASFPGIFRGRIRVLIIVKFFQGCDNLCHTSVSRIGGHVPLRPGRLQQLLREL